MDAAGSSRTLAKAVDINLDCAGFNGKLHLAFISSICPLMLFTCSSIPDVNFEIRYGEQLMNRLSNLACLVLKSLINSHLTIPNAVPILFRDTEVLGQKQVDVPISLFNSTFLKDVYKRQL